MKKIIPIFMILFLLTACQVNVSVKDENKSGENIIENEIDKGAEIMKNMSLEEKIEQMLIIDYSLVPYAKEGEQDATKLSDTAREIIENHNLGGVILFRDNTKGTAQTQELVSSFQVAATTSNKKYKIPLFMCIDQEGGRVTRLGTGTSLPGNMALGAINDYDTTKEYAQIIGSELKVLGLNMDFAPVLDVNNNPSNPVIGSRSFSSDPERVAKMGEAFIDGLHSENVVSTLKHFPGHGDTATDSHTGLPLIDKSYDEIKSMELIPFKAGIDKDADMIMTAHIVYPQIETTKYISKKTGEEITLPATLSKTILTDILRKDLGFEGVIVTDALNMGAIAEHFEANDVARLAINAGVDVLLMPVSLLNDDDVNGYINMVAELVRNGDIDEARIDESVARILKLKQKMGLLDDVSFELTEEMKANALSIVGSKANHDKELEIAKAAITLVKGEELLPIDKTEKVMFLLAYANDKNSVQYAIQKLKDDNVLDDSFNYELADFENKSFSDLKNKINDATVYVITSDTYKSANFDNNNEKSGWQGRFIDEAIKEIHKQNKKVIIVSCMLPYDVARYSEADGFICTYGDKAISELPIEYNGETATYGANIAAGIIKLFSGEEFKATLPVDIYKIDSDYNYTSELFN